MGISSQDLGLIGLDCSPELLTWQNITILWIILDIQEKLYIKLTKKFARVPSITKNKSISISKSLIIII